MKPRWLRRNVACPDCGYLYESGDHLERHTARSNIKDSDGIPFPAAVDCPKCGSHWTWEDFWNEQHEKWEVGGYSSRTEEEKRNKPINQTKGN